MSTVLLLTFFVYASVSSTLFQAFACEDLGDGNNYLRADYRIECDSSKHRCFQVYAGYMVVLYAVGIPAFYGVVLFRDRGVLRHDQANRIDTARVTPTSDLWSPYKPFVFYEVIECGRRILLAGVVVFIYPNTAALVAIALMMALEFAMLSEGLARTHLGGTPGSIVWVTRLVVFISMYVALLLKVDVTSDRRDNHKVFEVFLDVVYACMILVVVVETAVLTWALKDRTARRIDA